MPEGVHAVFGPGAVGTAVIDELLATGQRVRAVSRSGADHLPDAVEQVRADASDPALVHEACVGAAVVYNCVSAPYAKWAEFPPVWRAITDGAAHSGARLIVTDNVYMYGDVGETPMTEDMPYKATTRKGRIRAEMAQELMEADKSGRVRVAIGRSSDFFGPRARAGALTEQFFGRLAAGKRPQLVGDLDAPHSYAYVPDVGRALVTLGQRDEALGAVWHVPCLPPVATREYVVMASEAAATTAKPQVAPKAMLRVLGLFDSDARGLVEMLYQFEQPFVVDSSKFEAAFGGSATPMEEAVRTTYEWFRDNRT